MITDKERLRIANEAERLGLYETADAWRKSANTRPFFCKKYGFRMVENCGECIQPDPCYRIDCFPTAPAQSEGK